MKNFWLLTTLLISSLLLTGCNNHQYNEEFSEYWLLQWPNGTITLEDFKKAWTVVDPENFEEWEMCNTPELACVPIILKDDNTLITPHEFNTANIEEWRDDNIYFTDLKTFHKVTWLKEASPEYVQQYSNLYSFDPYVKFYKTREEKEALIKVDESTIEEDGLSKIENLKQSFEWDIIDWTNTETVEITEDNTLYYNDKFWFAVILWEQWKWWKVQTKTHNEQRWENAISRSIEFHKEWFEYDVYQLTIDKIEKYDSMKKHDEFWTEDDFIKWTKWKNNKYFFIGYGNDQLAPYIDASNDLIEKMFPDWFIFYDIN